MAAMNCGVMETTRRFTFNNETDKTAFMIAHPKKNNNIEKLDNQITRGEIKRTKEYKYLGDWYNEKYTHEKTITMKINKINYMIGRVKYYGDPYKVGHMALQVRLTIYKSTIIHSVYTNVETWSKISKKEIEQLEKMQKDIITAIFELPKSTPYLGLLSEGPLGSRNMAS